MKKYLALISVLIFTSSCGESFKDKFDFLSSSNDVEASEDFVQGSEDIPLLVGMEKTPDEAIGFDSSSGSIISSSYVSKLDNKSVRAFYVKTLPQMGWNVTTNLEEKAIFKRDNEKLEIEFATQDKENIVTFFISSAL